MLPNVNLTTLEQLLSSPSVVENIRFDQKAGSIPAKNAALTEGYHLYVEFGLNLKIAAAEDDASAIKYLRTIETFAAIGEQAAQLSKARILEINSERIHFLIESPNNQDGMRRLLTLAYSVVNVAYEKLSPIAGDSWAGCKATADHGKAVILISDIGGGSVVSLGNVANRPAKRLALPEGVKAGHLAMPENLMPTVFNLEAWKGWKQLYLLEPSEALRSSVETEKRASLGKFHYDHVERKKIEFGGQTFYDSFAKNASFSPVKIQGFCLRADLDGFSRQVEEAFSGGYQAVIKLVAQFYQLLELPAAFTSKFRSGRTLVFPWAGDCATVVVLPNPGETFSKVRETIPATSSLTWHRLSEGEKRFLDSMGTARWAVGVAAGDGDDGNEGRMLVTDIRAQGRTFKVVAGWAARRSSDAYQLDGIKGTETVVPEPDYQGLAEFWKDAFNPIPECSSYRKATKSALERAEQKALEACARPNPVVISSGISVPAPRSYFGK
jgi:hypothetical protein